MQRNVNRHTSVEDDGSGVLVEERLDADDFVSWIQVCEESGIHS